MSTRNNRGFTLAETLIATAILLPGLAAVSLLFSFVIGNNASAKQTTTATMVLTDKMEELRSLPLTNSALNAGGGLNAASPTTGYYDYVTVAANGAMSITGTSSTNAYLRLWQVSGTNPKTITIEVHTVRNLATRNRFEVARGSTIVTDTF